MSDLIIKIGDDALNLSQGETIAITKQAAKVGDFSRVLADGTNEVTIPPTSNNIAILENAHLIQSESDLPYRRLPATVIQEGYETLQDAFATIKSSKDNFSLQVIGGNASFFNLIKDLNLRDLDLTEYDHFWTNQNVFDNRNNTEGFIYALFEQSDATGTTLETVGVNDYDVNTEYLLPCFFIKTLVDKIFSEQGYDFVSDITALDIYDDLVVYAASTPNRGSDMSFMNLTVECNALYSGIGAAEFAPFQGNNTITQQGSIYWDYGVNPAVSDYLVSDNTTVTFTASFIMTNNDTVSQSGVLNIYHSTQDGIATIPLYFSIPVGTSTISLTSTFDCVMNPDGDCVFDLEHIFPAIVDMEIGSTMDFQFAFISNLPITTSTNYYFIRGLTPVPDMKQGEFLKELAKIFQLVYDTDEVTHTVTARRFDEIKDNIPNAVDFSDKLHNDPKTIDIQYQIAGYAQTNYLKWKPDDITKYNGQGIINVDDQTLEAEKTILEMAQFAASSPVTRFDTKSVPYIPLFTEGLPTNGMTDRMLLIRRETFAYNINFNRGTDLPTDDVTFAYFAEAGNTDSLDFPTLIERFYQTLNDMLYKAISITCLMNLKIKDVVNYNPFIPVYISKFSNYFYWEKLSNYVKDKKTSIKITRL